ncbi:MAG: hybrid sensor histidine kinase/response regulator [Candidatus Dormiibacterota bacterium]
MSTALDSTRPSAEVGAGPRSRSRSTILLVDDRPENLDFLEDALSPLGQTLVSVLSGEQALAALLDLEVALIVLDVRMPGMDGFETAAHIRRRRRSREIPIIFVTAADDDLEGALRAYSEGAVDYLARPLNPNVLRSKASVFVELHETARLLRERSWELERSNTELAALAEAAEAANRSKSAFLSMVGHELRTPLAVVSGYASLLLSGGLGELDQRMRGPLTAIEAKSEELHRLVEMLLQAALLEAGIPSDRPRRLDLNEAATAAVERARSRAEILGADLDCALAAVPVAVEADPDSIARVLDNLVNNALVHGGVRPVVRVAVAAGEPCIRVEDRGPGVPAELGDRIFERFVRGTTDGSGPPGVGLGLHICRELVLAAHGSIALEPGEGGRGTRFVVRLPVATASTE